MNQSSLGIAIKIVMGNVVPFRIISFAHEDFLWTNLKKIGRTTESAANHGYEYFYSPITLHGVLYHFNES